jgi:hypothetical protein
MVQGQLRSSTGVWKIWGNSLGALDWRADPRTCPPVTKESWPPNTFAALGGGDYGTAWAERAEIYPLDLTESRRSLQADRICIGRCDSSQAP